MILLFIHLDEELVWTECCGALQLVHRGSSHLHVQLGVICYCCWYMFLLVYPLAATPLFPHVSSPRGPLLFGLVVYMPWDWTVALAYLQDSPKGAVRVVHHRDFPLVDAVMDSSGVHANFSHRRVSPDLSAMASPPLYRGSLGHGA